MDEFVAVPDPDIVHGYESARVVALTLRHHGAGTDDKWALNVRQHAHSLSTEGMVEGLTDNGLLVSVFNGSAPCLVAQSCCKVR